MLKVLTLAIFLATPAFADSAIVISTEQGNGPVVTPAPQQAEVYSPPPVVIWTRQGDGPITFW
jgi:hypothetical protein